MSRVLIFWFLLKQLMKLQSNLCGKISLGFLCLFYLVKQNRSWSNMNESPELKFWRTAMSKELIMNRKMIDIILLKWYWYYFINCWYFMALYPLEKVQICGIFRKKMTSVILSQYSSFVTVMYFKYETFTGPLLWFLWGKM